MTVENKVAIVTGGARGLGYAMAEALAAQGAQVVIADIDSTALAEAEKSFADSGLTVASRVADMSKVSDIDALIDGVVSDFGHLDILVNNAGIQIRKWATEFPEEEYDLLMDINLKAYYFASRAAARHFQKQGGGAIVCTSSANSTRFTTRRTPYCISKAAINGLVAALANEWGRFGIRVNAVAPGFVLTEMVKKGISDGIIDVDAAMSVVPMKRFLDPAEIANAALFLASDAASGITGQTLFVDGGWSINGLPEAKDIE
ncbi:MAG: SDR family oxidoreductase [Actinomycetaceae bacterium]|nr:SDR family oxidoreductase [Actinomycetaceae bacterium]